MSLVNKMQISFPSRSINESFARVSTAAFISQLDPTLEEISDIKTIVSEAVTNCIVHGYAERDGDIIISVYIYENRRVRITVKDKGIGISDIKQAMEACFTTGSEDRAGMGFTIMQTFSDKLKVRSVPGKGTVVTMEKILCPRQ
ncbi:MAG: anti-sigma F factor [Ruminococcaceae bacterium]|nr:anti-sigma F factor [Oscillospiraceae bacterium]MBQ2916260.1 anti-sigma F factor [Clostridia bacterium]